MSTSRPYSSSLREQGALQTRLRIRKAAATLFASDGFAETTVAAIAKKAGVAAPTVFSAFGSKGGIVAAMLEELDENADRDVWVGLMMASQDPVEQARLFSSWIRNLYEGGAPILRAAMAARAEPDVAVLVDRGDSARREGTRELAGVWAAAGALREGLDHESAAENMWLFASVEQYLATIDVLGWSPDDYEQWLSELLQRELLAPT